MDQLEYISKGRSISSDGTNQPSSKRSRLASYHSSSNHNQQELHHRKLQLQQRAHHHQQQQETLLRKQEAAHAVVMAQHQQREQFIHSMRARPADFFRFCVFFLVAFSLYTLMAIFALYTLMVIFAGLAKQRANEGAGARLRCQG